MTLDKKRIACIIVAFLVAVGSLAAAIVLLVQSNSVCVPFFVTAAVTALYSVCYVIARRKDKNLRDDVEMAFLFMLISVLGAVVSPIVLVLLIVEKIVEAISYRKAPKDIVVEEE